MPERNRKFSELSDKEQERGIFVYMILGAALVGCGYMLYHEHKDHMARLDEEQKKIVIPQEIIGKVNPRFSYTKVYGIVEGKSPPFEDNYICKINLNIKGTTIVFQADGQFASTTIDALVNPGDTLEFYTMNGRNDIEPNLLKKVNGVASQYFLTEK